MAEPRGRNQQIIRQWQVLRLLEEGPRSLLELAGAVGDSGVVTRTIRRDLEALEAAMFPIYNGKDEDGITRWRLLSKNVTPRRAA
jgi:predicted DNA-binding transcriptional regulator YafY